MYGVMGIPARASNGIFGVTNKELFSSRHVASRSPLHVKHWFNLPVAQRKKSHHTRVTSPLGPSVITHSIQPPNIDAYAWPDSRAPRYDQAHGSAQSLRHWEPMLCEISSHPPQGPRRPHTSITHSGRPRWHNQTCRLASASHQPSRLPPNAPTATSMILVSSRVDTRDPRHPTRMADDFVT